MPTIIKGKFETSVTMRSSVLICVAESSSMVAVYRGERESLIYAPRNAYRYCLRPRQNVILTSLTNMMGKMVSLMNLVLLRARKRRGRLGSASDETRRDMSKVGESSTYGKPLTLFRMILS